jgi:hypothetical protein
MQSGTSKWKNVSTSSFVTSGNANETSEMPQTTYVDNAVQCINIKWFKQFQKVRNNTKITLTADNRK